MDASTTKRARTDSSENSSRHYPCHNGAHLSEAAKKSLALTANELAAPGKGITACDESAGTIGKPIIIIVSATL